MVEGDEVLAIKQSGQVTRSAIDEHLRPTGRDTKGVRFVGVSEGDGVVVVARSVERAPEIDEAVAEAADEGADGAADETSRRTAPRSDGTRMRQSRLTRPADGADRRRADDRRTENEES